MGQTIRLVLLLPVAGLLGMLSSPFWRSERQAGQDVSVARASETEKPVSPGAARVERTLRELESNHASGNTANRTYTITEADLNAYLEVRLREKNQRGVETLSVRLQQEAFVSSLMIDMDKVEVQGDPTTLSLFKVLFRGPLTLEVEGRLVTVGGRGRLKVTKALLNESTVPPPLVDVILRALGGKQDPPFDPTESFDLPYGIRTVTVKPGQATLQT